MLKAPIKVFTGDQVGCSGADPGFGQGGPQLPGLKVANVAGQSHTSEVSYLWQRSRACLSTVRLIDHKVLSLIYPASNSSFFYVILLLLL